MALADEIQSGFPPGVEAPHVLRRFCGFVEAHGGGLASRFEWETDGRNAVLEAFDGDNRAASQLAVFGRSGAGLYAFWLHSSREAARAPVVYLDPAGSESRVVAADLLEFLKLLALGYEDFGESPEVEFPQLVHSDQLRQWLSETLSQEFTASAAEIVAESQARHPQFGAWLARSRSANDTQPTAHPTVADQLETLARFSTLAEAQIAKNRLAGAGILAFLADAEMAGTLWHLGGAVGGVKLQIAARDRERAVALLALDAGNAIGEHDWNTPPPSDATDEESQAPHANDEADGDLPESLVDDRVTRAFRAAIIGYFILPVQLYSIWLLIDAYASEAAMSKRTHRWAVATLVLDLPVFILLVFFTLLAFTR